MEEPVRWKQLSKKARQVSLMMPSVATGNLEFQSSNQEVKEETYLSTHMKKSVVLRSSDESSPDR